MILKRKTNYIQVVTLLLLQLMSININATTFTVTNIADTGVGSLRQAIIDANSNTGADEVRFNIPETDCDSAGICHIVVSSDLPTIADALLIDGSTQPQYGTAPANVCATQSDPSYMRIELNTTGFFNVLTLNSPEPSVVKGLSIGGVTTSANTAVYLNGNAEYWVNCNHLGLNAQGTEKLKLQRGLCLGCSGIGNNGIIGTNSDGINDISERNVITANSGIYQNGWQNYITAGNYFALTADGLTGLASTVCLSGRQSSGNRIGSNLDGFADVVERNIFGNCSTAINFTNYGASGIQIAGNWIGVNSNGTSIANTVNVALNLGSSSTNAPSYLVASNWIDSAVDSAITINDIAVLSVGSTNNCITNSTIGLTLSGTSIDQPFIDNYWGDASGPSGVGTGTGASIVYSNTGTINYDPWNTNSQLDCKLLVKLKPEIFNDGFETSIELKLFDYIESISKNYPHNNKPTYDFNNDSLQFYGHSLQLNNNYSSDKTMLLVKYWMHEILMLESKMGDFNQDLN